MEQIIIALLVIVILLQVIHLFKKPKSTIDKPLKDLKNEIRDDTNQMVTTFSTVMTNNSKASADLVDKRFR